MNINDQQETGFGDTSTKEAKPVVITRKQLLIAGISIVFLFGALLIWKSLQISSLKKSFNEKETALKTRYKALHEQQSSNYLRHLAKPYVWALRTEMMQGNNSQVNLYNNDMVKEKNFISVMVADEKGIIISSTDKKYEGKNFLDIRSAYYINNDTTVVNKANDSLLIMSSPIMSFNSKLGTLIINYASKTPEIPL